MKPNREVDRYIPQPPPETPRRVRWWIPLLAGLALLLAGLLWCGRAEAYTAPDGAPVRWRCPGGSSSVVAITRLNKAAGNPIGTGPGGNLNAAVYAARYGAPSPDLCKGVAPTFLLYAEAKDSYLAGHMRDACLRGDAVFQDQRPNDCWPKDAELGKPSLEAEDYAAVVGVDPLGATSGGGGPAVSVVPWIEEATSPAPGVVSVKWLAKGQDYFEVRAGETSKRVEKDLRAAVVELPPGVGGELQVTVATFRGTEGRSSLAKTVTVTPRESGPEPLPQPPAPPAEPPLPKPVEPAPPGPSCPPCDTECPGKLASAAQRAERAEAAQSKAEADLAALLAKPAPPQCPAPPFRCLETLKLLEERNTPLMVGPGWRARFAQCRGYLESLAACLALQEASR